MHAHGPSEPATSTTDRAASRANLLVLVLVVAAGLLAVLATYPDYGATWDEGVQAEYGELALDYFASGGVDTACNEYLDLRYYGPLVEMVPALFYEPGTEAKYAIRHLFLGLLSVLSLPAVWLFARRLGGGLTPAFAVLAVATLPRLVGHAFNNSKDTSFALSVTWFMVALAALFGSERIRPGRVLACGLAVGLGLCARPGGLPLFVLFLGCGALAWLLGQRPAGAAPATSAGRSFWREALALLPPLAAVFAIAWPIMVAPWPWAHESPLANPIEAIRLATAFPTTVPVLFGGERISSAHLPWDYLFRYLVIATPPAVLGLALVGLGAGLCTQLARWRSGRAWAVTITQVWLFAPLALFVVMRPNIHGGVRHFLFMLPALGLLAAVGAAWLVELVAPGRFRALAGVVLGLVLLAPVPELARLHPYQVAYYNAFVGGLPGASETDWTDYYLSSYPEAIRWIGDRAEREPDRTVRVWLNAGPSVLLWARDYAAPNVELSLVSDLPAKPQRLEADYYVTSTRFGTGLFPAAPVVHEVGREGVAFTVVKGRPTEAGGERP